MSEKKMLPTDGGKNPIVAACLSLFLCGIPGGQFYLGQTTKGIILFIATIVLSSVGIGVFIPWLAAYEAYAIAKKLEDGEEVSENEWAVDFLNNIFNK